MRHKLWEIPAGLLDVPGENPLHAAQRELYEEAHVKAEDWRVLTDVYASPGGWRRGVRIFLARGLSEAEGERFEVEDEEADLEYARVPVEELVRGALAGELHNACLVVGVLSLVAARPTAVWTGCGRPRRTGRRGPSRPDHRFLPAALPDAEHPPVRRCRSYDRLIRSGDVPYPPRSPPGSSQSVN